MRILTRCTLSALVVCSGLEACLPIPDRVTETVAVSGVLRDHGQPVARALVSAERPQYVGPGQPGECSGVSPVTTDSAGVFQFPTRKRWVAWTSFIGESPEWHMVLRLCLKDSMGWRPLYLTRVNGWDGTLQVTCDLAAPVQRDEISEKELCTQRSGATHAS